MPFSGKKWLFPKTINMNKKIKYISYFDFQDSSVNRNCVPSACNKIESICELLNKAGIDVQIVSMAAVSEPKIRLYRGSNKLRRPGLKLKLFLSWGGNNKLIRKLRIVWHLTAMFIYLVYHTRKNEPVLVYHSQGYYGIIHWAKKIRKFKLILEVEEIYQDVRRAKYTSMDREEHKILNTADAYIFPTQLMNDKLNPNHKPSAIIHGSYTIEPINVEKFTDGKIHVVYAGTFDPAKGGALTAIKAIEFLPANYHLHICGFGTPENIALIKNKIEKIKLKSKATISFDGLKKGREYIEFIQRCHIGLSTQDPSAAFNDTSFPSKILSYIANGLSVVSVNIPVVRTSAVAQYITYYQNQTPEEIAQAIITAPLNKDYRKHLVKLADQFTTSLLKLL